MICPLFTVAVPPFFKPSMSIQEKEIAPTGLGARVKLLREERGWSQAELASHLPNVKQQSIDQLERGKVVRPRFLPELADILKTSVPWLLTGDGTRVQPKAPKESLAVDARLLRDVFLSVEEALATHAIDIDPDHKALLVSTLYELVREEEQQTAQKIREMAENLVRYDKVAGRM